MEHRSKVIDAQSLFLLGAMSAVLAALPFNLLVQVFLIVRVMNLGLEYRNL